MFIKIKNWIKTNVFNIKPIFKIKIKRHWISEELYAIKFSNNNGWSWRYIQQEDWDPSSHCHELRSVIGYFRLDKLKEITSALTSYESCDEYNKKLLQKISSINKEQRQKYYKLISERNKFIDNFNKNEKHS